MPSSDRFDSGRDRQQGLDELAVGPLDAGKHVDARAGGGEPSQYFDPSEPWDAQSAEALTRLYESGEADLDHRTAEQKPRRWQPPPSAIASEPISPGDNAWLEARLADMTQRLQDSLAEINPDKSLAPLNRRLDLIEERFGEALAEVAQRSDLDALRLIEANVLELSAHVEQSRGRLDRLDAIDDQVRGIALRLEEGDNQRLAALESVLQGYIAEWRRGDERTVSALQNLEEVVNRVGEAVEAVEAHKPVPDISQFAHITPGLDHAPAERDPLSQAYADAALALEQPQLRTPLDAADYTPQAQPVAEERLPPSLPRPPAEVAQPPAPTEHATPTTDVLASPAFRASAMRAKLRQAQMLRADEEMDRTWLPPPKTSAASSSPPHRARAGLLLAAGIAVFAAGGYLLVDALMSTTPRRTSAAIEHGAGPLGAKTPSNASEGPAGGADTQAPDAVNRNDKAPALPPQDGIGKAPAGQTGLATPAAPSAVARVEAIGNTIAAVFRGKTAPRVEPAAIPPTAAPDAIDGATVVIAALPMTIGPASLRQAALRGDATAQFEIAARFAAGAGVPRDLQQAVQWYRRAAAQGMALAQYRLATLHERGWGTPADPERARVWYARAAEQGNVKSMHNLAVLSVSGSRSDYATAAKWFAQAADMGLADSQFNLAVLHQTGLGVPKDLRLAYKWLALAGRAGDREAVSRIAELRTRLAAGELREAEAMVASWRAHTPDPTVNEVAALTMDP
jgi:localization factor PodJL